MSIMEENNKNEKITKSVTIKIKIDVLEYMHSKQISAAEVANF